MKQQRVPKTHPTHQPPTRKAEKNPILFLAFFISSWLAVSSGRISTTKGRQGQAGASPASRAGAALPPAASGGCCGTPPPGGLRGSGPDTELPGHGWKPPDLRRSLGSTSAMSHLAAIALAEQINNNKKAQPRAQRGSQQFLLSYSLWRNSGQAAGGGAEGTMRGDLGA